MQYNNTWKKHYAQNAYVGVNVLPNKMFKRKKTDGKEETRNVKTATITRKHKKYTDMLNILVEKFPCCFSLQEPRVLKVGIHFDLLQRTNFSKHQIWEVLMRYCSSKEYLNKHVSGADRYDLDGNIVGIVLEEEAKTKASITRNKNNVGNMRLGVRAQSRR